MKSIGQTTFVVPTPQNLNLYGGVGPMLPQKIGVELFQSGADFFIYVGLVDDRDYNYSDSPEMKRSKWKDFGLVRLKQGRRAILSVEMHRLEQEVTKIRELLQADRGLEKDLTADERRKQLSKMIEHQGLVNALKSERSSFQQDIDRLQQQADALRQQIAALGAAKNITGA